MRRPFMTSLSRYALLSALLLSVPAMASAQSSPAKKIAPGVYQVVPDANFAGGMDLSAFSMRFEGDSVMVIEQSGAMMTRSRTSYDGEHLVWTDLEGELMCPGTARYKLVFSQEGRSIRLTPVEDGCAERSAIIAQISLQRKGG
ncbi:MAG: hypothetical protein IPF98_20480 [Gemmatimonadetes bacterium]|nr:hypothetical protein [Gemmatimonadota bacterium]